jgi:hypothetical protein
VRRLLSVFAFPILGPGGVASCGARSAIEATGLPSTPGDTVPQQDGAIPVAPMFCSERLGPIDSCLETDQTGSIGNCGANNANCVILPGTHTWGCCMGEPPYNGPSGVCSASVGSGCPVFRFDDIDPTQAEIDQCLPRPLPMPNGFVPECIVAAARFPSGTGTPAQIAACQNCAEPGLMPPSTGIPLATVSPRLAQYSCVCLVNAAAPATCPRPVPQFLPSWCYEDHGDKGPCTPSLALYIPMAFGADFYIACFDE